MGFKDENGYVYITGRDDDVINVAGHRISTSAVEDAILRNSNVCDAAVFGVPDATKGEVPLCLYIMNDSTDKLSAKIDVELINIIRDLIGPVVSLRLVAPVSALPRTRSGKFIFWFCFCRVHKKFIFKLKPTFFLNRKSFT